MCQHPNEVDVIFVGGGSTACVAAGRLAAANPGLEIIIIEQGPNNLNDPTVFTPGLVLTHLVPGSQNTIIWSANKSDAMNGRTPTVHSGGMLGGGSSINWMVYSRPSASDFDDWQTPGWRSKDLIPLLRKFETYHPASGCETHGHNGPIHVSHSNYYSTIAQEYLDVCARRGVPRVEDSMDTKTGHGCQHLAKYIHPLTGHRQDAAHCYIHNQANNSFLHILTETKVVRVVFEGNKATGVEVVANETQAPNVDQTRRTISARKMVVVSAGAIGSPIILQRSGVGSAERLSKLGIKSVADLHGVGCQYGDHTSVASIYHVANDVETLDCLINNEPGFMEQCNTEFADGKGFLTTNTIDAGCKLRPTSREMMDIGPDFQRVWKNFFEPAPDKPVVLETVLNGFPFARPPNPGGDRFVLIGHMLAYQISRGHVFITSTDPYAELDFNTGFIEEQADIDVLMWAYKKCREVVRRMPSFRGDYEVKHPIFPHGSTAACVRLDGPPASEMEDLTYTAEDDQAIIQWIRQWAGTTWHQSGTISMKRKEDGGCVDERLNVYGTTNLKVADLSILPGNVGANTHSTALMIGEKAAMLIAEDLGLNLL